MRKIDYIGKEYGTFVIFKQGKNFIGKSDSRSTWWGKCKWCGHEKKFVGRNLTRLKKFNCEGCRKEGWILD